MLIINTWIQAMGGRQPLGCSHTQNASDSQKESYQYAVRLHIAIMLKTSKFQASCVHCNNTSLPLCCLECDYIGCPRHTDHKHTLACCLGSDTEGAVWCFKCNDIICDPQFDVIRDREIHRAMHALDLQKPLPLKQDPQSKELQFSAFSGLRGLVNLGATCYVSVVLQSLVHNPLVRAFFLGGGHLRERCTRNSCLVCAVDRLYSYFFGSANVSGYGITDLLVALAEKQPVMGAGSTEQDAHEFYLMLLNEFHSAHHQNQDTLASAAKIKEANVKHEAAAAANQNMNNNGKTNEWLANGSSNGMADVSANGSAHRSINGQFNGPANGSANGTVNGQSNGSLHGIKNKTVNGVSSETCNCVTHRIFAGYVESVLSCECGKITERREQMVDIGLDLGSAASTTLESSLQRFTTPEKISHYTCDACTRKDTTTKQLRLAEPPPVLLIQLKRFKHLGGSKGSVKVETPIDFPLQIDLAPYTTAGSRSKNGGRSLVYELYGVICHIGTLDTGHYTCMMKHSSGQWYNFDDVAVTPVDVETVRQARRAYLLFYIVKWAV